MTTKQKAPTKAEQVKAETLKAEQAKAETLKAEQAKADEVEKTVYQLKWTLLHNGKKYGAGDVVELTDAEVKDINASSTVLMQAPLAE